MSRVFVVNEPLKWDEASQSQVKAIDLSPAVIHGELIFLLPAGRLPMDPTPTLVSLRRGLADFKSDDYLLLVGDPRAIAWAAAIAADQTDGQLQLLHWQRGSYAPVRANVFEEDAVA